LIQHIHSQIVSSRMENSQSSSQEVHLDRIQGIYEGILDPVLEERKTVKRAVIGNHGQLPPRKKNKATYTSDDEKGGELVMDSPISPTLDTETQALQDNPFHPEFFNTPDVVNTGTVKIKKTYFHEEEAYYIHIAKQNKTSPPSRVCLSAYEGIALLKYLKNIFEEIAITSYGTLIPTLQDGVYGNLAKTDKNFWNTNNNALFVSLSKKLLCRPALMPSGSYVIHFHRPTISSKYEKWAGPRIQLSLREAKRVFKVLEEMVCV